MNIVYLLQDKGPGGTYVLQNVGPKVVISVNARKSMASINNVIGMLGIYDSCYTFRFNWIGTSSIEDKNYFPLDTSVITTL